MRRFFSFVFILHGSATNHFCERAEIYLHLNKIYVGKYN